MPKRKAPSTAWKPGQSGNPRGSKPEKLMRDALLIALNREAEKGTKTKRLQSVAEAIVNKALEGDVPAIKEIFDRVDGKVPQENHNTNELAENTLEALLRAVDGRSRDIVAPTLTITRSTSDVSDEDTVSTLTGSLDEDTVH